MNFCVRTYKLKEAEPGMSNRNTLSPQSRRAMREDAEAAALAELEFNAAQQREKSRRLRLKRLAQAEKEKQPASR